MSVIVEDL
jgi:phospholipid-transporting ATPase